MHIYNLTYFRREFRPQYLLSPRYTADAFCPPKSLIRNQLLPQRLCHPNTPLFSSHHNLPAPPPCPLSPKSSSSEELSSTFLPSLPSTAPPTNVPTPLPAPPPKKPGTPSPQSPSSSRPKRKTAPSSVRSVGVALLMGSRSFIGRLRVWGLRGR